MEITLYEIWVLVNDVIELMQEEEALLPVETVEVINSLADGKVNTDVETSLEEIKNALMYNEDYTALQEISSRLEVIDTRLDTEFLLVNEFFGLVSTILLCFMSFKFFSWVSNTFSP